MMPKAKHPEYEVIRDRRRCDAKVGGWPDYRCRETVTHWAQPKGYVGPVYCRRHAALARAR
jgi:hypothetical protein